MMAFEEPIGWRGLFSKQQFALASQTQMVFLPHMVDDDFLCAFEQQITFDA
jgi:hypothetical protein